MKKALILILLVSLALSLTFCGGMTSSLSGTLKDISVNHNYTYGKIFTQHLRTSKGEIKGVRVYCMFWNDEVNNEIKINNEEDVTRLSGDYMYFSVFFSSLTDINPARITFENYEKVQDSETQGAIYLEMSAQLGNDRTVGKDSFSGPAVEGEITITNVSVDGSGTVVSIQGTIDVLFEEGNDGMYGTYQL